MTAKQDEREYTFLGMRNRVLAEDGAFGAVEITVPPGSGPPPHTNTREALAYYGLEGMLSFMSGSGDRTLRPGDFISMPKGDTHTFVNRGDGAARALLIVSPAGFERFFADASKVLPAEAPAGPPSAEILTALAEVGERYGMTLRV